MVFRKSRQRNDRGGTYRPMKNLLKEVNKITSHYFHSDVGKHRPRDDHYTWVLEGPQDYNIKKAGYRKGNRKK